MVMPASSFTTNGLIMSPSVAVQLRAEAPVGPAYGFPFSASANSNKLPKAAKPRRRAVKDPLPPKEMRNLPQKIQAADEHWQDLIETHNKRLVDPSKTNDLVMLAAFSCFIHAVFEDKNLCGELLRSFDKQIKKDKSRLSASLS